MGSNSSLKIGLLPVQLGKGVVERGSPVPLQRPHKNGAFRLMWFQLFLVKPLIRFFGCNVLKMVILGGFWYTFILCMLHGVDVTCNGRYLPGRNCQPVPLSKRMLLVWLALSVDFQFLARAYWLSAKAVKSQDVITERGTIYCSSRCYNVSNWRMFRCCCSENRKEHGFFRKNGGMQRLLHTYSTNPAFNGCT